MSTDGLCSRAKKMHAYGTIPIYLEIICTQLCNANQFNLLKPGGKTCLALMFILAVLIQFFAAFIFSESLSCTKKCDGRLPSRIRGTPIEHNIR